MGIIFVNVLGEHLNSNHADERKFLVMASKFKLHNSKDFHTFENISALAFFFTCFDYP